MLRFLTVLTLLITVIGLTLPALPQEEGTTPTVTAPVTASPTGKDKPDTAPAAGHPVPDTPVSGSTSDTPTSRPQPETRRSSEKKKRRAKSVESTAASGEPIPIDAATSEPASDSSKPKARGADATLVIRDAKGRPIGTMPNPEASVSLDKLYGKPQADDSQQRSPASVIINTILYLALVLVAAYLVLFLLKRYTQGGGKFPLAGARPQRLMRIIETLTIGQGHRLHLVAIGDRRILVAQTPGRLVVYSEVDGEWQNQEAGEETAPADAGFAGMLSRLLPRGRETVPDSEPTASPVPLARYYQQRQGPGEGKEGER